MIISEPPGNLGPSDQPFSPRAIQVPMTLNSLEDLLKSCFQDLSQHHLPAS